MAVHKGKLKPPGKTMTLIGSVAIQSLPCLVGRRQDQRGERACDGHPGGRYSETCLAPTIKNKSGDRSHQTSDHRDNIADSCQGSRMRAFRATTESNAASTRSAIVARTRKNFATRDLRQAVCCTDTPLSFRACNNSPA